MAGGSCGWHPQLLNAQLSPTGGTANHEIAAEPDRSKRPGDRGQCHGPTSAHRSSPRAPHHPKVACNSGDRTFSSTPKRCNSNDAISMFEMFTWELHATFLRNHSARPRRTPSRRQLPGDAQDPETHKPRRKLKLRRRPHPRQPPASPATAHIPSRHNCQKHGGTAPDMGRYTRYGALHPIWGATPEQKRCIAYGSGAVPHHTRTNAELATRTTPRHNQPRPQPPALGRIAPQRHKRDRTPLHALLGTASGSMGTPPTLPPIGLTCA